MGAAFFYHLTQRPLEEALPQLILRARAAGWRVAVRGTDRDRLDWLDRRLWLGAEESFLPHGLEGGPHDARQPVLLTLAQQAANDPHCLMAVDGAPVAADEVARLERVCILFDGLDEARVAEARTLWRALTQARCPAQYWSEASGRWEKRAEA